MNEKFSNRCRACAELIECSEKMIPLFKGNLCEMFTKCTSLMIGSNDRLPTSICLQCFGQLSNFNQFRQNCAKSEEYFLVQLAEQCINAESFDPLNEFRAKSEEDELNLQITYEVECHLQPGVVLKHTDPMAEVNSFDRQEFICDYCGKVFDRKSHIGSHMAKHKNDFAVGPLVKSFPCTVEGCPKMFATKRQVREHKLETHKSMSESLGFQCTKCPKSFTLRFKLDAHVRSYHEGLMPYKCTERDCDEEFSTFQPFEYHLQFMHNVKLDTTEEKKHRCPYDGCGMEFVFKASMRSHINKRHKRKNQVLCDHCGQSFTNAESLKRHKFSHDDKLPLACKICPKTFHRKAELDIHTIRHLKIKPFVCPTCGVRKTTGRELRLHINIHTRALSYPCEECPKVFTTSSSRGQHVKRCHRNIKPHICPHCDRAFAKPESLKNHVMTHTGEKPFACSVCGHRCIQLVALKAHMKTHTKT